MKKIELTDPKAEQAAVLYKSGASIKEICKMLRMDGEVLNRILNAHGLKRTHSASVQKGKTTIAVKHDAFEILTPEALYWIGFLYADGHIEKDRPRIAATVINTDRQHMEKLAEFVGTGVRDLKGGYSRISFSSKQVYDRLRQLGFTNRKTWDIEPHEFLQHSRDFWRGVIDGDGWICSTKKSGCVVGVSGHEKTLKAFIAFLQFSGIPVTVLPHKDKRREFLWKLDCRGNISARKIATLLYKDATVYLERKYQAYMNKFSYD